MILALTADDWAQVGSALFAALAAGASWATVAQVRRERKDRELPDIHMEVIERIPSGTIDIHFANYGGPAKKVVFCLIEGGRVAYGSLPPNSHLDSNEHRTISTGLTGSGQPRSVGFVAAFNITGDRLFAYALNGKEIRRRIRRLLLPDRTTSDSDVFKDFYPEMGDITTLEWVAYEIKHD